MLRVELLPAEYGDCILLSYGDGAPRHVLIDAGTMPTWQSALRPHLVARGVRHLELFVLTHIDADHIAGAIPMLEDPNLPVTIDEVWFNGWQHLPKRFLSVKQGERFSELIRDRRIPWNAQFGDRAACVDDTPPKRVLRGGLELTLLSPTPKELGRLAREWKREIDRHFLGIATGVPRRPQFLARHPTTSTDVGKLAATTFRSDTSIPNGSSIALLVEYEGRALILAGDAHVAVLRRSIDVLLRARGVARLGIDALKVSHHGSRGNTSVDLLQMLDCRRFLISCNGDVHNLPDNEAVGRILQHGGDRPHLYFNYHCPRTQAWDDDTLRARYRFETHYGNAGFLHLDL